MRTAHSSTPGAFTITPSIGFRLSKLPLFGRDSPSENGANTLPLYTLPFGAGTWRFRLFTSAGFAFRRAGESLYAITIRSGVVGDATRSGGREGGGRGA